MSYVAPPSSFLSFPFDHSSPCFKLHGFGPVEELRPAQRRKMERVKIETIDEQPIDESFPVANFPPGINEECILEENGILDEDFFEAQTDMDGSGSPLHGLIDTDDEEDEMVEDPTSLRINRQGCVFTGENRKKFDELCSRYSNIFSKNETDLGLTNLLYHGIELTTKTYLRPKLQGPSSRDTGGNRESK